MNTPSLASSPRSPDSAAALHTYRRALRRYVKRARKQQLPSFDMFSSMRLDPDGGLGVDWHQIVREIREEWNAEDIDSAERRYNLRLAYLYERAAFAGDRYRAALSKAALA